MWYSTNKSIKNGTSKKKLLRRSKIEGEGVWGGGGWGRYDRSQRFNGFFQDFPKQNGDNKKQNKENGGQINVLSVIIPVLILTVPVCSLLVFCCHCCFWFVPSCSWFVPSLSLHIIQFLGQLFFLKSFVRDRFYWPTLAMLVYLFQSKYSIQNLFHYLKASM